MTPMGPKPPSASPAVPDPAEVKGPDDLPPVVARMVVEIRSDGRRTIARGALEDLASGQTVAIEADAASPWELSRRLVGALFGLPRLARAAVRALKPPAKRR